MQLEKLSMDQSIKRVIQRADRDILFDLDSIIFIKTCSNASQDLQTYLIIVLNSSILMFISLQTNILLNFCNFSLFSETWDNFSDL